MVPGALHARSLGYDHFEPQLPREPRRRARVGVRADVRRRPGRRAVGGVSLAFHRSHAVVLELRALRLFAEGAFAGAASAGYSFGL